jgi:hypothetical protein
VWEARLDVIAKAVNAIPGVHAEIYYRKQGNEVPHLAVHWDEAAFGLTKQQCIDGPRAVTHFQERPYAEFRIA